MKEKIVEFLKKSADNYLSGEEISEHLDISRAGIWKHMEDLRAEGYTIEAVPHLGYKLISFPDKLLPSEIQFHLNTKIIGKKIIQKENVTSTMDVAFEFGTKGEGEGLVVCAETQTKGRGRLGRSWNSPKGKGIYFSLLLRPRLSPMEVSKITLLSAVSLTNALKKITNLEYSIKWPNDILIHGKKVAGILTELSAEADQVKFIVLGVGLNVNTSKDLLPPAATSLFAETKKIFNRVDILKEILRELEKSYLFFQKEGFASIAEEWRESSSTLHKRIKVVDQSGTLEGEAVDIDSDGGLLIRKDNGVIVKKMAGDVVPAR